MDGRRVSPLTIGRPEWDIFLVDASANRVYNAIGSGPIQHGKASLLLHGKRGSPESSESSTATVAPSLLPRLAFAGVAGTPAKAKSVDQPAKAKPVSLTKSTPATDIAASKASKASKAGNAGRTKSETWDDVRYTSAVRMQKMQRGHSTRQRLRAEHLTVEDARAVTKIQAVARGRAVRRREMAKVAAKQAKAATKLATVMRGKLERRAVRKAKEIMELEVTKLVGQAEDRAAHQASLVSKGQKAQAELHALVASTQGPNASWSESIGMRMRAAEAARDKQLEKLYKDKKERALVELLQMVAESEEAVASREVHTATAAAVQGRLLGLLSLAQTAMAAEAEGRKVNEGAHRCALHDLVSLAKVEAEAEAAADAERMTRAKSEAVLGRLGVLLSLVQTLAQAAATMQLGATQEKLREIVKLARSVGEAELAEAAGAETAGAAADAAANAAAVRVRLHTLVALAQEVAAAAGDAVPRELKLRELLRMAQEVCRSQEASVAEATERAKASAVRSCITKASAEAQALVAEGVDASREQLLSLVEMASEVKLREMADHAAREVNAKAAGVRTQLANLLSTIKTAKAEDASGTHSSTQLGDQMRELISLAKQVAKAEVAAELEATKASAAAEAEACAKAVAVHGHLEALVRVAVAIADSDDVRVPTADPQFKQLALQLRVLARELLRMDGDADVEARAMLGEHVGGPRVEHLGEFILGPKASALRSKLQLLVAMASACELRVANDMSLVSRAAAAGAAAALAVAALPGYLLSAATSKTSALLPRAASVAAGDIRTLPSGESAEGTTVQEQLRALLSLAMEVARMKNEISGVSDIEAAANEVVQNTLGDSSVACKVASRVLSAATTRMAAQRAKAATKIEAVCRGKHARKEVAEGLTRQQLKLQRYVAFTGGEAGMGGLLSGGTDSFLIWAATRPTVAYPEVILNDLFSQRKTCVARLRTSSDLTRLLRNGDYYVAVPELGGEGGAGAGPLLTYKQALDATVPGSAESKAAITAVVAHESANAYDNSHKPWRVPTNTKSTPPVYKGQHLLLRCWAIESHAEFGSAWRSPNMGSHLVTPNMQKACGIEVHDASDVQRLYDRLYPDDDLTEILPKPDAVICHVVELVAVLSLPHEATAASPRDYRVTKALEPSTQAILASKEKAKRKKKKVLKALPEPILAGAVTSLIRIGAVTSPEPPPSKRSPTTSMTAAKSPTPKVTPKATPLPSFRRS